MVGCGAIMSRYEFTLRLNNFCARFRFALANAAGGFEKEFCGAEAFRQRGKFFFRRHSVCSLRLLRGKSSYSGLWGLILNTMTGPAPKPLHGTAALKSTCGRFLTDLRVWIHSGSRRARSCFSEMTSSSCRNSLLRRSLSLN